MFRPCTIGTTSAKQGDRYAAFGRANTARLLYMLSNYIILSCLLPRLVDLSLAEALQPQMIQNASLVSYITRYVPVSGNTKRHLVRYERPPSVGRGILCVVSYVVSRTLAVKCHVPEQLTIH